MHYQLCSHGAPILVKIHCKHFGSIEAILRGSPISPPNTVYLFWIAEVHRNIELVNSGELSWLRLSLECNKTKQTKTKQTHKQKTLPLRVLGEIRICSTKGIPLVLA